MKINETRPTNLKMPLKTETGGITTWTRVAILTLGIAAMSACGNDTDTGPDGSTPTNSQYVMSTVIFGDEGFTGFVLPLVDLSSEREIDLATGVEISGRAIVSGRERTGEFYVTSDEEPSIISKWSLNDDGVPERIGRVSFSGLGVPNIFASPLRIVSDEDAVMLDPTAGLLVRWNPSTMEIIDTIDLSDDLLDDSTVSFGELNPDTPGFLEVGGKVALPLAYYNLDDSVPSRSVVVLYDPGSQEADVLVDTRCHASKAAPGPDGHLYMASNDTVAATHRIWPESSPAPCLLRVRADTSEFDSDYMVDLNELTGAPTMGVVPGRSGSFYLRALDETQVAITGDSVPDDLVSSAAWQMWRVTGLGTDPQASVASEFGYGASRMSVNIVEGRVYFPRFTDDFATTDWLNLSGDTPEQVVFSSPGIGVSLLRVN